MSRTTYCYLIFVIIIKLIAIHHHIFITDADSDANHHIKSESIHSQLISLKQFCETKYNDTIEPEVAPNICPKLFSTGPHIIRQC